jgi:hypothetical protein
MMHVMRVMINAPALLMTLYARLTLHVGILTVMLFKAANGILQFQELLADRV